MSTGHHDTVEPEEPAPLSRRGFLRSTAASAAVLGTSGALAAPASADDGHGERHQCQPREISIQLYTVRDILAQDLDLTLSTLAEIGYRRVETAGFVGLTAAEFRQRLDQYSLRASSNHMGIPQPFDAPTWRNSLRDAVTLWSEFVVVPFFGIDFSTGEVVRDSATWRAFAHDLNRAGEMAHNWGLRLGYHNHNWEFFTLTDRPDRTAFELLLEETDPRYVHFELDLFWSWRGATDPVDLLCRYPGRFLQLHVKDMNQAGSFADLGTGLINFPRIFDEADETREFIVERDDAGTDPREPADALETAEVGFDYLSSVRF
jgi:sugar phosphate isomerase/epimerase